MLSFLITMLAFFLLTYPVYPVDNIIFNFDTFPSDEYIVTLDDNYNVNAFSTYDHEIILKQYESFNSLLIATKNPDLLNRSGVIHVERNGRVFTRLGEQQDPTWNLDRIDARDGLNKAYKYSETGKNVNVYVVDTGISPHKDFEGRLAVGYSVIAGGTLDCNGHGTHVAGIVGGTTYGVAKNVTLYPIRVLGCQGNGTMDWVLSGLEWVMKNAKLPAVVNMSLGGSKMMALNMAVDKLANSGINVVVAAGNSLKDACEDSPSSALSAITVAASDASDRSASFTSYGTCVSLYAPGVNILSTWIGSSATKSLNGTSMAAPHVAGAVALLIERNPNAQPSEIKAMLLDNATKGAIVRPPVDTPNLLLYTNPQSLPLPPSPPDEDDDAPIYVPDPPPGVDTPSECINVHMCYVVSGRLTASSNYDLHPKSFIAVNYRRPIHAYAESDTSFTLHLYYSSNNGDTWQQVSETTSNEKRKAIIYNATAIGLYVVAIKLKDIDFGGTYNMWIVK